MISCKSLVVFVLRFAFIKKALKVLLSVKLILLSSNEHYLWGNSLYKILGIQQIQIDSCSLLDFLSKNVKDQINGLAGNFLIVAFDEISYSRSQINKCWVDHNCFNAVQGVPLKLHQMILSE